jgi:isopenicillin N synthase-like dioxygenase
MTGIVPIIDLRPYRDGSDKARVAKQVGDACEKIGFLVVTGHGIPEGTTRTLVDAAQRFFALPTSVKSTVKPIEPGVFRGYSELAKMALSKSLGVKASPDLREGFTINRVQEKSDPYYSNPKAGRIFADNVWPREQDVPGFREAFTNFYFVAEELATTLMRIFALALELPEQFFDDKIDKHFSNLCAYHYPPMLTPPQPGQLRGGAHTDFGSLTLVYGYPTSKGLQVWNGESWDDVPSVPNSFVVNIGDLMAQWTNDRWVSTLHRVANPAEADWGASRYSIVFFHQPNYDVVVENLDRENAPKYPPITSGEHLVRKLSAMRSVA